MRCHSFERLDTDRCRKQRCSPRHRVIYIGDVLILPTALWILRFKRNIFFSPFPSLDLCFLSAVTRTSRSSLRGKPREGEATGELLLSAANPRREVPLLFSPTHPSSHSPFLLPLFSRQPSSTPYYVDPSDVLYFTSILRPLPGGNILVRSILSLWTYTSSIRYHRLVCSFQYESLNDAMWRQPPDNTTTRVSTLI